MFARQTLPSEALSDLSDDRQPQPLRFLATELANIEETDFCLAAGKLYEGPVNLDDHFTELQVDERSFPVDLRVDEIRTYGHLIDSLPEGLTGELKLAGRLPTQEGSYETFLVGERIEPARIGSGD